MVALRLIWAGFLAEIALLGILKPFVGDFQVVALIAVTVHFILALFILMQTEHPFKAIFAGAFAARFAFMLCDFYARAIFVFPGSGADSEGFYIYSIRISRDLSLLGQELYGGVFTKAMGLFFNLIGPQRMVGQYLNVLLGLTEVYLVWCILEMLAINRQTSRTIVAVAAFLPNSLIMAAIFLREEMITFFVALSVFYLVRWYVGNRFSDIIRTLLAVLAASTFHSGMLGLLIGYCLFFALYDHQTGSYRWKPRSAALLVCLSAAFFLLLGNYEKVFAGKFANLDNTDELMGIVNARRGGSAYLTSLRPDNPVIVFVLAPIYVFFFLASPLPFDWRGGADVISFLTDSVLYLAIILYFFRNLSWFAKGQRILSGLLISLLGVLGIFAVSVTNAGTAMRHRQKLVVVFLVFLALMMDRKKSLRAGLRSRDGEAPDAPGREAAG